MRVSWHPDPLSCHSQLQGLKGRFDMLDAFLSIAIALAAAGRRRDSDPGARTD